MQIVTCDSSVGKEMTMDDSSFILTPIIRNAAHIRMAMLTLEANQTISEHEANPDQLFLVVQGSGWVSGSDATPTEIRAGQAAFFAEGEKHASGTNDGMVVLSIEGIDLHNTIPLLYYST
ncbi:cupin domain-containing protein [Geomicrobium sp. JSM 1781026]|uniref:cupin domain-containing protein n=1 Tax=Geomicrobium sp. JSM 1781026 TaxID=3344580 RepID=UPI0035BF604D